MIVKILSKDLKVLKNIRCGLSCIHMCFLFIGLHVSICDCDLFGAEVYTYPVVTTNSGTVIGKYNKAFNKDIAAFLGIPYAMPPIGNKRFTKPVAVQKWKGVKLAVDEPSACMQTSVGNVPWLPLKAEKSEDCLYLNIWTSINYNISSKLPVFVWIHGGGFYSGSASLELYDGSYFSNLGEVVLVSMNYRVGLFGFLNGGISEAPGNLGLYDQLLALKWIKENIYLFGGDPNEITAMGESAGGASISYHLISPLSQGLFHKAIVESGIVPHLLTDANTSLSKTNKLANVANCSDTYNNIITNPVYVINCLRKKNSLELTKMEEKLQGNNPVVFIPYFGHTINNCNELLPESPSKVLENKKPLHIPILLGNNKNEGSTFLSLSKPVEFSAYKNVIITVDHAKQLIQDLFSDKPNISFYKIFDYYFQNIIKNNSAAIVQAIANAHGDFNFNCPSLYFAERLNNSYLYWFTHRSKKDMYADWIAVGHFSEVQYVFGNPLRNLQDYTVEDQIFSWNLMNKWFSFAKNGHPLSKEDSHLWPKFNSENPLAYELDSKKEGVITFPRKEACEFWRPYMFGDIAI